MTSNDRENAVNGSRLTIAVLYPGEMGARVGEVLRQRGLRVVTALGGRSESTARRCREAGIEVLQSLSEVIHEAHVVFSLVPPAAAEETASIYCELSRGAPESAVYVDANSIGPELVSVLAQKVTRAGRGFVDAAINGLAKNLTVGGTLFLSGARAPEIAGLFGDAVRVRVLGEAPGRASAMKMLLAGVSKGICALFAELALLASQQHMAEEFTAALAEIYPGVHTLVDRMLPTYRQHAARRATEMSELEQTVKWAGLDTLVIPAIRQFHEALAEVRFDRATDGAPTAAKLMAELFENRFLSPRPSSAGTKRKDPIA